MCECISGFFRTLLVILLMPVILLVWFCGLIIFIILSPCYCIGYVRRRNNSPHTYPHLLPPSVLLLGERLRLHVHRAQHLPEDAVLPVPRLRVGLQVLLYVSLVYSLRTNSH